VPSSSAGNLTSRWHVRSPTVGRLAGCSAVSRGFGVLDAIQRWDFPLTSDKIQVLADTPADLERVAVRGAAARARSATARIVRPYVPIGYALMTLPSPEPPSNRLRPDQASGPQHVLTDSAPAAPEAATPLVLVADRGAARSGLYDSSSRCLSSDVGCTRGRRTVAHSRGGGRGADRRRRGSGRHLYRAFLANPRRTPTGTAPNDSAAAAVIEMLFRQGLLQQPISIDDMAEGASWNGLARRALLVVRIEGTSRQPVRLVCYARRPTTLSRYADVAEAFAHHASLALGAVTERDNLNQAVAARHRVGLAQGILMTRRRLTAEQAFTLLRRESQNTHVKLRTIAQTVIQTGDLPVGTETEAI
jgi:ANTAR domain